MSLVKVFPRSKPGASGFPLAVAMRHGANAGSRQLSESTVSNRRGERRKIPRYHPSSVNGAPERAMSTHLVADLSMGATHPSLLEDPRSDHFLRPAAPERVPSCFACSGLSPSPDRFGVRCSYWSPSVRVKRLQCVCCGQRLALTVGGRQRVVRVRRGGRLEGERESISNSMCWWEIITVRPPTAGHSGRGCWRPSDRVQRA